MKTAIKLPARSVVVAPRLPLRPRAHTGDPFTSDGDIVLDCDVAGCGWHAMGPRLLMRAAFQEHYRQFHSATQEPVVVLLNSIKQ